MSPRPNDSGQRDQRANDSDPRHLARIGWDWTCTCPGSAGRVGRGHLAARMAPKARSRYSISHSQLVGRTGFEPVTSAFSPGPTGRTRAAARASSEIPAPSRYARSASSTCATTGGSAWPRSSAPRRSGRRGRSPARARASTRGASSGSTGRPRSGRRCSANRAPPPSARRWATARRSRRVRSSSPGRRADRCTRSRR